MSYRTTLLSHNPIWYARLQEAAGVSTFDDIGSLNRDGSFINSPGRDVGPTLGTPSCVYFQSGAYGISDAAFDMALTNANIFTVVAWVKFEADLVRQNIVTFSDNNSAGLFWLEISASNGLLAAKNGTNVASLAAGLSAGQWYRIVYRRSGSGGGGADHSFWVDDTKSGPTGGTTNSTFNNGSQKKLIGARTPTTQVLSGQLAEIAVFNAALSDAQIDAQWAARNDADAGPANWLGIRG